MITRSFPIFFVSCVVGFCFSLIHVPLPWTLGPLATAVVWKIWIRQPAYWSKSMRNIGMAFLGYVLGSPITLENGQQIVSQLPVMLLITLTTITLCLLSGYIAGRYTGIGLESSLIGSMPGGLSQMSVICEETQGTDVTAVTMMQTIRVITVVFTVPFLALHGIANKVTPVSKAVTPMSIEEIPMLAFFAFVIVCLVMLAKYMNVSSPYVLAPIFGTAALVLSGMHPPALPPLIIAVAQVCVGIRMGLDVEFSNLPNWKQIAYCSLISVLSVIILLLGIAYIFSQVSSATLVTAFLSMAPGGISEMGLTATIANADLPTVVAYQLFRLLFVLLVGVPVLKWWLAKRNWATQP